MIVILGIIVVLGAVLGGFCMSGGKPLALLHLSELIIIGGAALGALLVMTPRKVLMDVVRGVLQTLKGSPYTRARYDELFKVLYEVFVIGRRDGMVALEEHVHNPQTSALLGRYPGVVGDPKAVDFLCGALRPIVDGRVRPEQLKKLLDKQLEATEAEYMAPVSVLTKTADSLPGFGIVAAVLGIVVTMGAINGPVEEIGEKVAAALVGTFLGILLCYGFVGPMAANLEFIATAEVAYMRCIATAVNEFVNGAAPITAVEVARRGLSSEVRPSEQEMESMLKSLKPQGQTQPA